MSTARPTPTADDFRAWQQESRFLDHLQVAFIVGPPKCGTTWVMRSLDGHPNAVVRGESSIGRALVPNLVNTFRAYNAHQAKFGSAEATRLGDRDFHMLLRQIVDRQLLQYSDGA